MTAAAPPRTGMRPTLPLRRIDDDPQSFEESFRAALPVVIAGAARRMPAFERWTDAYLTQTLADARPVVRLADGRNARMHVKDFLDYLAEPARFPSSLGPVYLTDFYVRPGFLEPGRETLGEDVACPLPRGGPYAEWITLYAGPAGTGTSMHQDVFSTHTWLAQLRGEKVWRLCAPAALEPGVGESVDAFGDDDLGCDVYEAILGPGDVIYLPPDWWHQVVNRSASMALSGNFCTFDAARASLAEVLAGPDSLLKDVWSKAWRAVLEADLSSTRGEKL